MVRERKLKGKNGRQEKSKEMNIKIFFYSVIHEKLKAIYIVFLISYIKKI